MIPSSDITWGFVIVSRSGKQAAVLLSLVAAGFVHADNSDVTMKVRPQICIVDKRNPDCDIRFRVQWESRESGGYCLRVEAEQPPPGVSRSGAPMAILAAAPKSPGMLSCTTTRAFARSTIITRPWMQCAA